MREPKNKKCLCTDVCAHIWQSKAPVKGKFAEKGGYVGLSIHIGCTDALAQQSGVSTEGEKVSSNYFYV